MGLLLLENNWDKWMEEFEEDHEGRGVSGDKQKREGAEQQSKTKHTTQGKKKGNRGSWWSDEGKLR
jgi:hypothetical protein